MSIEVGNSTSFVHFKDAGTQVVLAGSDEECRNLKFEIYRFVESSRNPDLFRGTIMSDDTLKIKRRLSTLVNLLDELETGLAALLSQSLPELVLGLDTTQQAKLQVIIQYLVYDLVFGP